MSTTTFESIDSRRDGVEVTGNRFGILIGIKRNGVTKEALTVTDSSAPAIALAILEAACFVSAEPMESDHDFFAGAEKGAEYAVMWLRKLAEFTAAKASELAERELLKFEALELLNAAREADDNDLKDSFADCRPGTEERWVAVAKCARRMVRGQE